MPDVRSRLGMLSQVRHRHLAQLRADFSQLEKDKNGSATNSLVGTLRFLAVADYVLSKDIAGFKSRLSEAACLRYKLFARFDAGEPISPSYASMLAYRFLLNALAAGNKTLSLKFSSQIGGRDTIEREYDRPFDRALGYALKALFDNDQAESAGLLETLEMLSVESDNVDFKGYAMAIRAISIGDVSAVGQGFDEIIIGHKRQCKAGGLFKDTEDELLCVWGIGLANLARMRGLLIRSRDALIPDDLLIPVAD